MLCSFEKLYLKDINSYYIYWEVLHLPNFSNYKLLYILIISFPFCFILVNECLLERLRHGNLILLTSKPSLLLWNLNKELSLFFRHIKFMIFKTVWSKKRKSFSYSTTSFCFTDIYWMLNFDRTFLQIGFFFYRYELNNKFW